MGRQHRRGRKDDPRDDLLSRQRVAKPTAGVPHNEHCQKLEGRETEKPIGLPGAPSVERRGDCHGREHDKQQNLQRTYHLW
ncbi:MAG: hypothetical protein ACYS0K_18675, partial [Planctomycetota bacterium]